MGESAADLVAKMGHQRGPSPGFGANGRRHWVALVEDTPCLWVTWVTDAAKRQGRPVPAALSVNGKVIALEAVRLTFGDRYYFRCPSCGRRVETVFFALGRPGCRRCLRLGYRSQSLRVTSVYRTLDRLFARDLFHGRWYAGEGDPIAFLVEDLRQGLQARIDALFDRVALKLE